MTDPGMIAYLAFWTAVAPKHATVERETALWEQQAEGLKEAWRAVYRACVDAEKERAVSEKAAQEARGRYFIGDDGPMTREEAIAYYGGEELFDRAGEYGYTIRYGIPSEA